MKNVTSKLFPVVTLFMVAGCSAGTEELGPGGELGINDISTRLVALFTSPGAPGLKSFQFFYDKEIGQRCQLRSDEGVFLNPNLQEEGTQIRCLPVPAIQVIYEDANCSDARLVTRESDSLYKLLPSAHFLDSDVAKIGKQIPIPAVSYQKIADDRCVKVEWPIAEPYTVHEIVQVLPKEEFPAGRLEKVKLSEQLEVGLFRGDENHNAIMYYRDTLASTFCSPEERNGEDRCVPRFSLPDKDTGFRDADCQKIIINSYGDLRVSKILDHPDSPEKIYRFTVVEEGTPISRLLPNGQCESIDYWPTQNRRTRMYLAEEYPESEWPTVQLATKTNGRLSITSFVSSDLEPNTVSVKYEEFLYRYGDSNFDSFCNPTVIDGQVLCTPNHDQIVDAALYMDSVCTEKVLGQKSGAVPLQAYSRSKNSWSVEHYGLGEGIVYKVDANLVSGPFYQIKDGACTSAVGQPDIEYRRLSSMSADELVQLKIVFE